MIHASYDRRPINIFSVVPNHTRLYKWRQWNASVSFLRSSFRCALLFRNCQDFRKIKWTSREQSYREINSLISRTDDVRASTIVETYSSTAVSISRFDICVWDSITVFGSDQMRRSRRFITTVFTAKCFEESLSKSVSRLGHSCARSVRRYPWAWGERVQTSSSENVMTRTHWVRWLSDIVYREQESRSKSYDEEMSLREHIWRASRWRQ